MPDSTLVRRAAGVAALLLAAAPLALAAPITITRSAISQIRAGGVLQAEDDGSPPPGGVIDPGTATAQAIWPPAPTAAQARTAARSTAGDFAANARIASNSFLSPGEFDSVISAATYQLHAEGALVPQRASFEFFLPPAYLELVTNAETPHGDMRVTLLASLRICFALGCSDADTAFLLQATLSGDHFGAMSDVQARGDPLLDLSPLLAATPAETDDGFIRTVLLEFPAYSGRVDLGVVPGGAPVHVEYQLQARAEGEVWFSSGIAAINDPFLLDTDPVQPSVAGVLRLSAVDLGGGNVPAPATALLVLAALAAWRAGGQARRATAIPAASP